MKGDGESDAGRGCAHVSSVGGVTDDIVRDVIMGAYDAPRYGAEELQRREIQDYRNEIRASAKERGR